MEHSSVHLIDLPDEILMFIFQKLPNTDVLYSLEGVDVRLDKIVNDPVFARHLTLLRRSSDGLIYPIIDQMLDRFCSHILPKVDHKIKCLDLEPLSMERILHAASYPNLHELGLFNIGCEIMERLFIGKYFNFHHFTHIQKKSNDTRRFSLISYT
jgi:hypothetical protein